MQVNCPICNRSVPWDADKSPFRPFCTERCKLIDLGEWARGNRYIPSNQDDEEQEQPGAGAAPDAANDD